MVKKEPNSQAASVISLTTDFGISDWFVGTMEGVIAGISPKARVITISHQIPPQDIRGGAFTLAASYCYFPAGTIHVAIVDPGVGSKRSAIAVRTKRFVFLGPDNGVLSWALRTETVLEIRELSNSKLFLSEVSQTFHGRDVFAPVAAHLANGIEFAKLGPERSDFCQLPWPEPSNHEGKTQGEVVYIDRFGNCITNVPFKEAQNKTTVSIKRHIIPIQSSYSSVKEGSAVCVPGSHGYYEIAVNGSSARDALGLKIGTSIRFR